MSEPPFLPGISTPAITSTISSTNINHQLSLYPRTDNRNNISNASPNNIKSDDEGDGSSSSDLEEGEINERDLPPLPPRTKSLPVIPSSSLHYRKPITPTRPILP